MIYIDLYKFTQGVESWRYTSSSGTYSYDSETYAPAVIGRGNIVNTEEVQKNTLEIGLDFKNPLAQNLLANVGKIPTLLTMFRSINGVVNVWFKGRLGGIQTNGSKLTMSFVNIFSTLKRQGLRRVCSRECTHALYDAQCGVSPNSHDVAATVDGFGGSPVNQSIIALTANSGGIPIEQYVPDFFETGYMQFGTEKRMIVKSSGIFITISKPIGVTIGDSVTIFPGCDHSFATCHSKFGNKVRFGGLPYIPADNPFSGSDSL